MKAASPDIQGFLQGAKLPHEDEQIQREIHWFLHKYDLSPKVFIGYDRAAFVSEEDPELRITFDQNIRWRNERMDLRAGAEGLPVLPDDRIVIEIKLVQAAPLWLVTLLSELLIYPSPMTLPLLFLCLFSSMLLGVLTAMVFLYRSRHSASFALTLALLPMTVSIIIMLANGNIGTGVAVAGAFALVRFRSVPGSAREIAAIFASMALGLALGMGYVGIAVLFFLLSAVFTLLLTHINFGGASRFEKHLKITIPENLITRDFLMMSLKNTRQGSI